ncbi:hypothetical protein HAX54_028662 [Datura stramonium]|uniref:Uncharacterized protein n=1 Tax=Datura stramonium TaxID=4076 RepID=A0ABS8V5R0_DATST|nr:hypothetical protein [Datura stramonium]
MAQKINKGKGLASSSQGSKRARTTSEEEHEDVNMAPQPLRRYGLRWVTEKEGKKWFKEHKESKCSHDMFTDRNCWSLVFPHMVDRILTLGLDFMFNAPGDCNLNMGHDIEEEEVDYKPSYGPRGVDLRMNGVTEEQLQQINIDYPLSEHSQALYRVGPRYKEPLDDDVFTEDEMSRVDSDIE